MDGLYLAVRNIATHDNLHILSCSIESIDTLIAQLRCVLMFGSFKCMGWQYSSLICTDGFSNV